MVIETDRLILRRWQSSDVEPFVSLNADSRVMEFFPATLSRAQTEAMISIIEQRITEHGAGFWAAELKDTRLYGGFHARHLVKRGQSIRLSLRSRGGRAGHSLLSLVLGSWPGLQKPVAGI